MFALVLTAGAHTLAQPPAGGTAKPTVVVPAGKPHRLPVAEWRTRLRSAQEWPVHLVSFLRHNGFITK